MDFRFLLILRADLAGFLVLVALSHEGILPVLDLVLCIIARYYIHVQMIFELDVKLIFVLAKIPWSILVKTLFPVMAVFFMASVLMKFLWVYFIHVQMIFQLVLPFLYVELIFVLAKIV